MFSTFASLPPKCRRRLEGLWAGTFHSEVFCRLDERPFAVLYADEPSRPNIVVNVLVGVELMGDLPVSGQQRSTLVFTRSVRQSH